MNKRQNVATQSLGDARLIKSNRNNLVNQSPWAQRQEAKAYSVKPGNFTDYSLTDLAGAAGLACEGDEIFRAEYSFGKFKIVLYLRDGSQRSLLVQALYPVLEPLAKDCQGVELAERYVISPTQEPKEY